MKTILTIPTFLLSLTLAAQQLYVPVDASISVGSGATVTAGGKLENLGRIVIGSEEDDPTNDENESSFKVMGILQNNGTIHVSKGDILHGVSGITNASLFENNGWIIMERDFINTNILNTAAGGLDFQGGDAQTFSDGQQNLIVDKIFVDKSNPNAVITLDVDSAIVTEEISFFSGVLQTRDNNPFVLASGTEVIHFPDSYYNGSIIGIGNGLRTYPVGDDSYKGTITLDVIGASGAEIIVSVDDQPESPLNPSKFVLGVSNESLWRIEHRRRDNNNNQGIDSILVALDFVSERLKNFENSNDFRADVKKPAILYADSISGPYYSLGIDPNLSDEFGDEEFGEGVITSISRIGLPLDSVKYLAVGLAPQLKNSSVFYVPNVFSPNAFDPVNRTLRIFGEKLSRDNFSMQIYNRFSVVIYETSDLQTAKETGWNGRLPNGGDAQTGTYYVVVSCEDVDGNRYEHKDLVLLQR